MGLPGLGLRPLAEGSASKPRGEASSSHVRFCSPDRTSGPESWGAGLGPRGGAQIWAGLRTPGRALF